MRPSSILVMPPEHRISTSVASRRSSSFPFAQRSMLQANLLELPYSTSVPELDARGHTEQAITDGAFALLDDLMVEEIRP